MKRFLAYLPIIPFLVTVLFLGEALSLSILELTPKKIKNTGEVELTLNSTTDFSYQGLSVSMAYDPSAIDITSIDIEGTITEAIDTDFVSVQFSPDSGEFVMGILVDAAPPFDGNQIPGIGIPLAIANIKLQVSKYLTSETVSLRFVDGLGDPPTQNLLVVDNQSIPPEELIDWVIKVRLPALFVRGDSNQDTRVDLADPIHIFSYLLVNGTVPMCPDAADGNDDEILDISDGIFILQSLFEDHPLPAPHPEPGRDPTREIERLRCDHSAF